MNNLKTLNDLTLNGKEGHPHFHKIYCGDDLRAEAIKWIKELKETSKFRLSNGDEIEINTSFENRILCVWIKHFFNITDKEIEEIENAN